MKSGTIAFIATVVCFSLCEAKADKEENCLTVKICNCEPNLKSLFDAGILQWQVVRKELDAQTLLHQAILENSPEVVEFLLKQGVSSNYLHENGIALLMAALENKCNAVISVLLTCPEIGEEHLKSLKEDMSTIAEEIQRVERDLSDRFQSLKRDRSEYEELQNILIKYGCNVDGLPALHYAIKKGDKRAVEMLLAHGADVNTNGILQLAITEKQVDITRLLLDHGARTDGLIHNPPQELGHRPSLIHLAAYVGNIEIIHLLIERGMDISKNAFNEDSPNKWTPLHVAAIRKNLDAIKLLLNFGAEINAGLDSFVYTPGHGRGFATPLDAALSNLTYDDKNNDEIFELVRFLVAHGAKANSQHCESPEIFRYLLEKKEVWRR